MLVYQLCPVDYKFRERVSKKESSDPERNNNYYKPQN